MVVYESNRLRSAVKGRGNDQQTWSLRKEVTGGGSNFADGCYAILPCHLFISIGK